MNSNLNPSARASVVGVIDPDAYAAGTYTTAWVDMQDWYALLAVPMVGDFVATGVLNAKFQQATDAAGAGVKDVVGGAITAMTQAGTDDNKQALVNLLPSDLDYNAGFRFARFSATLSTAGADFGAVVLGLSPRYGDATANDAATVDEVVS
ncbi:MAG: hypothetical protein JWP92_3730 [Caulobacter sp.]|nr:hypothetical protein [Caulobacter sp.]